MSSSYTSLDPPFTYNPGCKPTKSILKQHVATSSPSSWLTRLSSIDSLPQPQSATTQQRTFGYFRKLINTPSPLPPQSPRDVSTDKDTSSTTTQTQPDELSAAELKRVRFSVRQMTTEYYPYASIPNDDNENDSNSAIDTTCTPPSTVIADQRDPDNTLTSHRNKSTDTTGHTIKTTPDKILSYYETACKNKEEPALEPFMVSLLTHQQASILTHIDLSCQMLTRRAAEPLADVLCLDFGLEKLTLRNCQLEDEVLKVILHSLLVVNHVRHLDLTDNKKIQANGFKYISIFIKNAAALETLDLSGTSPDKKAMQYMSQALSSTSKPAANNSSKLNRLIMDNCSLRQPQLESLGNAIRKSSVSYLSLRANRINQQGAICLGVMLRNYDDDGNTTGELRQLQHLVLDNNDLRLGVQYIAQALRRNQSLRSLSMADCKLDAECCVSVAESLKYNQSLETLNLSMNPLCAGHQLEGVNSLKQSLYCNHSLSDLALADAGIGSEGAVALAECLPENTALTRLDLSRNPDIDLAGFMALLSGLRLNSTLVFLDLSIPTNDRDMIKVQNEIAGLCTKNAQASDENTSRTPSLHSVDASHTTITTTQATARLTLQERLEAVTKGKNSRSNSIRSINSQENMRSTTSFTPPPPPPSSRSARRPKLRTNFDAEIGQVELLEDMLQAEELAVQGNGGWHPDDIIKQVYHQCRKGLLNLNNSIPQLMESDQLMDLLGLNDRLTTAISRYEELYTKSRATTPQSPTEAPIEPTQAPGDEQPSSRPRLEVKDADRSTSPFEIGDDDESDNDQGPVDDTPTNDADTKDIHELRKEKEVEEGVAFKHAKDVES